MYVPPPVEDFGGWYLRGDIGFSNQHVKRLNNALDAANTSPSQRLGFTSAGIFGLGVGYKFNPWFRGDVTASIAAIRISTASISSAFPGASALTPITPPNPNGWLSPTPMSTSVPGGA
jgi:hypothetical protein